MRITIAKTVDRTPALEAYIEKKFAPLAKFIKIFDDKGVAEIWLDITRTTRRHRKGEMYVVAADLRLPKKIVRAEEYADDIRTAIDRAKDTLRFEIEKYKTKLVESRRGGRK